MAATVTQKMTQKLASLGSDGQDGQFETIFANLAHTLIADRAPSLMRFEVGFQLVDRANDDKKAAAIAVFHVGDQWVHIPFLWINGAVKGHEVMFLKDQGICVPLKESWLNYIMSKSPLRLGKRVTRMSRNIGVSPPSLSQLVRSPLSQKMASENPSLSRFPEFVRDGVQELARCFTLGTKYIKEAGISLPEFLNDAGSNIVGKLLKSAQMYPTLGEALLQHHGIEMLKAAAKRAREIDVQERMIKLNRPNQVKQAAAHGRIVIMHSVTADDGYIPRDLGAKEREKLLRDGVLIQDKRKADEISKVYTIKKQTESLTNPTSTGVYEVLTKPGKLERCLVLCNPMTGMGRKEVAVVVRLSGDKPWIETHPSRIFARSDTDYTRDFAEWFDSLSESGSAEKGEDPDRGQATIAISPRRDGTMPFSVERYIGDEIGRKSAVIRFHRGSVMAAGVGPCATSAKHQTLTRTPRDNDRPQDNPRPFGADSTREYSMNDATILHIQGRPGPGFRAAGSDLYVPEHFKMFKVGRGAYRNGEDFVLGNYVDVTHDFYEKTAELKVYNDGAGMQVNGERMQKKAAIIHLVTRHGLSETAARGLIDETKPYRKTVVRVKYASPYEDMIRNAPGAPPMQEPPYDHDDVMGSGLPTQTPWEYNQVVPETESNRERVPLYQQQAMGGPPTGGMPSPMPQSDAQLVQDAASLGQKEVFDTAMIGSLLNTTRDDLLIDRYIPRLSTALDAVGRLLLAYYWHQEEFAERYGKSDMPDMEDTLRNVFESLGDLVLKLKEKAVNPYPEEASVDISDDARA